MNYQERLSRIANDIRSEKPLLAQKIDEISAGLFKGKVGLEKEEKIELKDVPSELIPEFLPKSLVDHVLKVEMGDLTRYSFIFKSGFQGVTVKKGQSIKNTLGFMGNDFGVIVVKS